MHVDMNQIPDWLDRPVAQCVAYASREFSVPPMAILLVMAAEGGRVGTVRHNKNGSFDMGPMQINSLFMETFTKYGVTHEMITHDLCTNIRAGTWHLKREITRVKGDLWKGIGNYHSRTPSFHNRYVLKVQKILYSWTEGGYVRTIEVKEE